MAVQAELRDPKRPVLYVQTVARARWRLASAAALFAGFVHLAVVAPAYAQAEADSLAAGRALFAEALADEDAGRPRVAVDKFRRVKAVRDTASVEYRIGACEEALGHMPSAYDAYGAAIAMGQADPSVMDVVKAARERVDALSKHVARLTLIVPAGASADLSVQVDDTPLSRETLGQPVALDPGTHSVVATSAGGGTFQSRVALPEGGEATLPIVLSFASPPPHDVAPSSHPDSSRRILGWLLVGLGGALIAGSVVALVLRHDDIETLDSACPGGACPSTANAGDLNATRNRALVEGPIAAGLGVGGVAAAAVGGWLVVDHGAPSPVGGPAARLGIAGVF
jgi:hypothetical protein